MSTVYMMAWLIEHARYSLESVCFLDLRDACNEARTASRVTGTYWSVYSSGNGWMLSDKPKEQGK